MIREGATPTKKAEFVLNSEYHHRGWDSIIAISILISPGVVFNKTTCYSDPPLEEEDVPKGEWLCHKCISEKAAEKADSEVCTAD